MNMPLSFGTLTTALFMLAAPVQSQATTPQATITNQCKTLIASGNAEYPPYLWRSPDNPRKLVGAIALMMEDLSQEIGVDIALIYSGPWGRVQKEVAAGRVDMIAGAFFTKARTEYMDYIYPEFQGTETAVWYNYRSPFNYSQWADLKSRRGVTVINNSFGQEFDTYAARELDIRQVSSLEHGLRMLSAGRVDYLIYEKDPAKAYARQLHVFNVQDQQKAVTRQNLYLTLSKASRCNNPALKQQLARTVESFSKQNRMERYLKQAHQLWAQQQTTKQ